MVSDAYGEDDFSRLGGDEDGYEEEEEENSKHSVSNSVPKSIASHSTIHLLETFRTVPAAFHLTPNFILSPPALFGVN